MTGNTVQIYSVIIAAAPPQAEEGNYSEGWVSLTV